MKADAIDPHPTKHTKLGTAKLRMAYKLRLEISNASHIQVYICLSRNPGYRHDQHVSCAPLVLIFPDAFHTGG